MFQVSRIGWAGPGWARMGWEQDIDSLGTWVAGSDGNRKGIPKETTGKSSCNRGQQASR